MRTWLWLLLGVLGLVLCVIGRSVFPGMSVILTQAQITGLALMWYALGVLMSEGGLTDKKVLLELLEIHKETLEKNQESLVKLVRALNTKKTRGVHGRGIDE